MLATPSVLVIARFAESVTVLTSVAELLVPLGSPMALAMLAVLLIDPVAVGLTLHDTVYVAVPPTGRPTPSLMLPLPLAPQLPPPPPAQVHVHVRPAG